MTKQLEQARGSNVRMAIGLETTFGVAAAANTGKVLKFNSSGLNATRDLNSSETIQPGRSPVEPFQGNGSVDGDFVLPLDLNQLAYIFRCAFGAPVTTDERDVITFTSVSEGSDVPGYAELNVATDVPAGITFGDVLDISGTTNYNGKHKVIMKAPGYVIIDAPFVAAESNLANAKGYKGGFQHVFTIKEEQPTFTIEQLHKDLAESFVYQGCKVSTLSIGAASDGQENTVTIGVMGSKPKTLTAPKPVTAFASGTGGITATLGTGHGLVAGDTIVIAGSAHYNGAHIVSDATTTTVTFAGTYTAETVTSGSEPVWCKAHYNSPASIPLARLGTFSARLYKDGSIYNCARNFSIQFDFGLDGDMRCIGDDGYRSSIPEGTVQITSSLTALFKSGDLFREGADNTTVGLKLEFTDPDGVRKLTIELPENKVQPSSPPVDSPRGLSQDITVQSFSSDSENGASACTITVVNDLSAV